MRLMQRLDACPARCPGTGRSLAENSHQKQSVITVDVASSGASLDEFVLLLSLVYTTREGRRTARAARVVHFSSPVAL